uniref:Uncharacterized protein n=1 Tax=Timema cristinae TaxID=61476 RepID=A0A7R9DKB8_TIMCR|nr:unnamed protein product [Timema cristinae]
MNNHRNISDLLDNLLRGYDNSVRPNFGVVSVTEVLSSMSACVHGSVRTENGRSSAEHSRQQCYSLSHASMRLLPLEPC